jgi:predicted RNase H-like HicB family nuclease
MEPKDLKKILTPAVLRKAEKLVDGYKIVIEPHKEAGFVGSAVEFPTAFAKGKTREECLKTTKEVLTAAVATMIHLGGTPPTPASAQRRTTQVNVRLTPAEKDMMSRVAAESGFKGLGDFLRAAAIKATKPVFKHLPS